MGRMTRFDMAVTGVRDLPAHPSGSSRLGFEMVLLRVFCFGFCDHTPREDHKQLAEEGGEEILEGNFQLSEPEVDSKQPEQLAANHRASHADQEVHPATQTLLFQSDSATRERSGEAADNDPHDDLANVHDLNATLSELKT